MSKGHVTIPVEVRERLGFLPDTEGRFRVRGDVAILYAEVSVGFVRIEELDDALPPALFRRDPLP